jgi:hypothetical protein
MVTDWWSLLARGQHNSILHAGPILNEDRPCIASRHPSNDYLREPTAYIGRSGYPD